MTVTVELSPEDAQMGTGRAKRGVPFHQGVLGVTIIIIRPGLVLGSRAGSRDRCNARAGDNFICSVCDVEARPYASAPVYLHRFVLA